MFPGPPPLPPLPPNATPAQRQAYERLQAEHDEDLKWHAASLIVMGCVVLMVAVGTILVPVVQFAGWAAAFKTLLGGAVILGTLFLAVAEVQRRL